MTAIPMLLSTRPSGFATRSGARICEKVRSPFRSGDRGTGTFVVEAPVAVLDGFDRGQVRVRQVFLIGWEQRRHARPRRCDASIV